MHPLNIDSKGVFYCTRYTKLSIIKDDRIIIFLNVQEDFSNLINLKRAYTNLISKCRIKF